MKEGRRKEVEYFFLTLQWNRALSVFYSTVLSVYSTDVRFWRCEGYPLQRGYRLKSSESDVCRRQILTTKIDPRTVIVNIYIMVVHLSHRYSNESERGN